ncbi:Vitamin K epoxide reductase family protein [Elizabethkingia miricola]|nr:Vitamin K epoxide reductase family protein [Elizabethkingia miricola]
MSLHFSALVNVLKLDYHEFTFQFQTHPNYPSALAFSDTLNFMGVKNSAYELEKEYWEELPEEFITIYKSNFSLIKRIKHGFQIFSEKKICISRNQLIENSENFVILFEREHQQNKDKFSFSNFIYMFLGFVILFSLFSMHWSAAVFNVLSIFGILISLEIYHKKMGVESIVVNTLCSNKKIANENSCASIIDSDNVNIAGLKLSDLSLVYFCTLLIIGLFFPETALVLKVLSLFSIAVICYSITIQVFVKRRLCNVCALIIMGLIGQIIISGVFFSNNYSFRSISLSVFTLFFIFWAVWYINKILSQRQEYKISSLKNLKFKKNYDIFKRELLQNQKIKFLYTDAFYLGSGNSKIHISLISNPYCNHCAKAHEILEKLLSKYPDTISAQIRFNYFSNNPEQNPQNLFSDLIRIYETRSSRTFLKSLHHWFIERNEQEFRIKNNCSQTQQNLSVITEVTKENERYGFTFTPVFLINGYRFPDKYERADIFYFIDELLEDEDIINEKN